jgi:geranylgeranyl pyrophosphate synthase/predicted secreted hydrolase
MEWWYVNSHVTAADGRAFSMFAAFFRVDLSAADSAERTFSHFLTWALVDTAARKHYPHTLLDPKSPSIGLETADRRPGRDPRAVKALKEVFSRNAVPLPDRLLPCEAVVAMDTLSLDYGGNRFRKLADGAYEVDLASEVTGVAMQLRFTPRYAPVRHGDDGVVHGLGGADMFYYFMPDCGVDGSITIDNTAIAVAGRGWYDHEFGDQQDEGGSPADPKVAWNWLAAQLDTGHCVSAYDLIDRADPTKSHGRYAIVVEPDGTSRTYERCSFESLDSWTSTRTFNEYPTRYLLNIPEAGISLDVAAAFPEQELITVITAPGFWEGQVEITGTLSGARVNGRGFVERSGISGVETIDDLFASVGRETRRAIDALLPERPVTEHASQLIGGRPHYLDGISLDQYSQTLLQPIREIILRGGKSWRSYGLLACMDVVGGDSQPYAHMLAVPELLHVGSLIIDDVQDESDVRRGGPSCHKVHGVPLAINAGCAAYFLAELPLRSTPLDDVLRVRVYSAYFDAVRAAHAGQAFDIDGLTSLMPQVVESGDGAMLERRVLGVHRLKSAAPAGALARMAALIGGGSEAQAEGLGRLFEAFGVAFQIIDDVLNLRGFDENRKVHAEDITAGKITAPVAKAMALLDRDGRSRLWEIVSARTADRALLAEAVHLIDDCGALAECESEARAIVEDAWSAVDPLVPDSLFKIRLRAFGWFVLDRHY